MVTSSRNWVKPRKKRGQSMEARERTKEAGVVYLQILGGILFVAGVCFAFISLQWRVAWAENLGVCLVIISFIVLWLSSFRCISLASVKIVEFFRKKVR